MIGIFAALLSAFAWTIASLIWKQQRFSIPSLKLNFIKNIFALILFLPAFLSIPWESEKQFVLILILSGVLGISIGDTFYFESLHLIGTSRTLIIHSLAPLIAVISGFVFLREYPPFNVYIGSALVSLSLFLVARSDTSAHNIPSLRTNFSFLKGIFYSFISLGCGLVAALLSRMVLVSSQLSPYQSSFIRISSALAFLLPLYIYKYPRLLGVIQVKYILSYKLFLAAFLGTFLGILLQQVVFSQLAFGLGVILLNTSPIFALLFILNESKYDNKVIIVSALTSFLGVSIALV